MRNLELLTSEKLLAIRSPEALFSCSKIDAKQEYRALARRWHPDRDDSPTAQRVFAHIADLYHGAVKKLRDGSWTEPAEKVDEETPGVKRFRLKDGSVKAIEYLSMRPFELGTMLISNDSVIFEVSNQFVDLFREAMVRIKKLSFVNNDMAAQMGPWLPQIEDVFTTCESKIVVLRKTPDQLLLADVLKHMGGRLDPIEHVGWILNVLLNLACYLEWSGTTHNAIALDTIFVSPLRHSGMLLGGWWYSAYVGQRLRALPDRSFHIIPCDILMNKCADGTADLELIKALGRELLGASDAGRAPGSFDETIPQPIQEWLQMPSSGSATIDYAQWKNEVLPAAFGRPKFVKLNLASADLYKEK